MEDAKETPEEMASNFTCAMFETPQAVLKGARHMVFLEFLLVIFMSSKVFFLVLDSWIILLFSTNFC